MVVEVAVGKVELVVVVEVGVVVVVVAGGRQCLSQGSVPKEEYGQG